MTKEAEVGVPGEKIFTCTRKDCDKTKIEEIPALLPAPEDSSSSEESVDSSSEENSNSSSSTSGFALNCNGSVTGTMGLIGVMTSAVFVLWKKKED